ncbi:MAG: DUF4097 family beta strand repeat protein [Clostridia bacterium]|nr:DUF4097 family beta strand repeat protein [Clostridia bacterium]
MTRKDYMEALESKLGFIPTAQRKAILDYYEEMVEDRMEDGMDEASAVAAMERPETIAERLKAEGNYAKDEPETDDGEQLTDEAMRFSSLAGSLLRTFEDLEKAGKVTPPETPVSPSAPEPEASDKKKDAVDRAFDSMDQALDSMERTMDSVGDQVCDSVERAVDFAGNKVFDSVERAVDAATNYIQRHTTDTAEGDYEKKTFTCPADKVRAIRLLSGEMPIRVTACEGNDLTLTYYTCDNDPYELNLDDGVLALEKLSYKKMDISRFTFAVLDGIIKMRWSKPAPTVELLLPRNALVSLTAHASNASVKVSGCQALVEAELKTSNSRIEAGDLSCVRLNCVSSNGRLVLTNITSRQYMSCKTSNSRIVANDLKSKGDMQLTTSNGHIEGHSLQSAGNLQLITSNSGILAEDCAAKGELRMTTSNGKLETWRSQGASIQLRTSNASIRGGIPGTMSDWRIESRTSNGKNSLPKQQDGFKPLTVSTSNGSIDLHFEG